MIVTTEFSFKQVFGPIDKVIDRAIECGYETVALCDTSTFGHVSFTKAAKEKGLKVIYGAEVKIHQSDLSVKLLARNKEGLGEIYRTETVPAGHTFSDNVILLMNNAPLEWCSARHKYADVYPGNEVLIDRQLDSGLPILTCCDMRYPAPEDEPSADLLGCRLGIHPQSLLPARELFKLLPFKSHWDEVYELCEQFDIPQAKNVEVEGDLEALARAGIPWRFPDGWAEEYEARLQKELGLIAEKEFDSYFLMVADLVKFAKDRMLVGPGRGSSAGSIVCYLTGITELDPIKHGLLFERFVDVTRIDLPDIDIDFPGTRRDEIFEYLSDKYGADNVSRLGNVSRLKPKSIMGLVAKRHKGIPEYEGRMKGLLYDVRDQMIERSSGDARAGFCLMDTLEMLDSGKEFLERYPGLAQMCELEGHASHTSVHAAAMLVCDEPITTYAAVRDRIAQLDKRDAEVLNLMKLDCLGLKTLDIIDDTLKMVGKEIGDIDIYDPAIYSFLNKNQMTGIFQLDGEAAKDLCRQIEFRNFSDIVAVTSLCRPGPLQSGGTSHFIAVRDGREQVEFFNEHHKKWTEETEGVVVYQEQILFLGRDIGQLGWPELTALRRAMSKSYGKEYFNQFKDKYMEGAEAQGLDLGAAEKIWESMMHAGSYAFVKAHASSYAMVTAYTAWLKNYHPLQFAAATLKFADKDSTLLLLREIVSEGHKYVPIDPDHSQAEWSAHGDTLLGGLTSIKGVGPVMAERIITNREAGKLTEAQQRKLKEPSEFEELYPFTKKYRDWYDNPKNHRLTLPLTKIEGIGAEGKNRIILGEMTIKNQRDAMETSMMIKLGIKEGEVVEDRYWLNFTLRDDTGKIMCSIGRRNYERLGKEIVEKVPHGATLLVKGREVQEGMRKLFVEKWKWLKD